MNFNRIKDFIINGNEKDFNYYGQRAYIEPSMKDIVELYDYFLYVAIKYYNCDIKKRIHNAQLKEHIPDSFLKNCNSFEEAKMEIINLKKKLSQCEIYNSIFKKKETLKNYFERFQINLTASSIGGGEKFYSHSLKNEVLDITHRLYIPCNSEHCYKFARLIIEKSVKYGLDFEFKIMNVEDMLNGADNIVMYIKAEDFSKQVRMINEIINENPDITFGKIHMFGYPVNEHIALAPEIGGNSYSGHIRRLIETEVSEYGKNAYCASIIQQDVLEILMEFNIIQDIERISKKGKR